MDIFWNHTLFHYCEISVGQVCIINKLLTKHDVKMGQICIIKKLLTKHEVKMAEYWPSSFFCLSCSRHLHIKGGQYLAILTKHVWSQRFYYNLWHGEHHFFVVGMGDSKLSASCIFYSWFLPP